MRALSLLVALVALLALPSALAAILAIDYGAEFTKLSLVKPGVPFDVLLDRDSKRKISSVVTWKRDDRVFGQEGKMAATRFPDTHYPYVKPLLASSTLPNLPLYPNAPHLTADGTLVFPHPSAPAHLSPPAESDDVWSPTALLAHQLSYYRNLAESLSVADPVTQAIVTVPAWWTYAQRRAYRDALELEGLHVLAMVGDGTAVGLNYAMTRVFPDYDPATGAGERAIHVVYDSGALQTTATVLAFYQTSRLPTPKAKTAINTTHIEVLGVAWEEVGGVQLDLAVQELLVEDFVAKTGQAAVRQDKRAMAKLLREAVRVKHILSANQESSVAIESLHNDIDYRSHLTRAALEDKVAAARALFMTPITAALADAGLGIADVDSLILFGGNTRVPLVHAAVRAALGDAADSRIAQNVNTDEAAVLGAAFYGAGLSRQFKMKSLEVHERSVYPVTRGEETVFAKGTELGSRRSLSLAPVDQEIVFAENGIPVVGVSLVNVADALANITAPNPTLNLTMRLDARGLVSAANAVLFGAGDKSGVAGALKGLFGKDKGDKVEDGEVAEPVEKVVVKFKETVLGVKHMAPEERRVVQARLASIAKHEAAVAAREEARNALEGYLYRLSNLLSPEADNRALAEFGTEKERAALGALLQETFAWLADEADRADAKTLIAKRAALETLEAPVIRRFTEWRTRGKAIDAFQAAMFAGRAFLVEARANVTAARAAEAAATAELPVAPPKYTDDELDAVAALLKDNEEWMDGLMKVQVTLEGDKTADPVIMSKDLDERGKKLQMTVLRLTNKKTPRAPRPVKPSSAAAPEPTPAEAADTADEAVPGEEMATKQETAGEQPPKHEEL
ncbi:lumenal Hsp70 protein [Cryptotrichosporon argae]